MSVLNYLPFLLITVVFLVMLLIKDKMAPETKAKLLYFSCGYIVHAIVVALIKAF